MSNLHRERRQPYNVRVLQYFLDHKDKIDKSQLSHLLTIQDKTVGLNEFPTTYNFKIDKKDKDCSVAKLGYGRVYGNCGSGEYLDYNYRNNLYGDTEHDIDMKNCHPTLLSQLARKKGFICANLEEYINHREEYLEQIIDFYAQQGITYTRRDAKCTIIALMYGAEIPAFKKFQTDLDVLTTLLKEEHQTLFETVKHLKQKNINGAFLSYIAQTEERKCLDAMDSFFLQQNRSVDGLAYDGLMVRKVDKDEVFPIELLRKAEQFVKEKTGYEIILEIKPMVRDIDDHLLQSKAELSEDAYIQIKKTFETHHFFCEEPEPCFIRYYDVPQENGRNLIRYSDKSLKLLLKSVKISSTNKSGKSCDKSFYDVWTEDATKRTYKRIGFYPDTTKCPINEFNSYLPASASFLPTADTVDITPIIKHFDVMADDDEQVAKFLIKFFAQIVQQPDKLPGIAVLLIAQEGAGKDIVADWIGKRILGGHQSIKSGKLENMMKNFNSHMSGRFLVHSDECEEATMRKYNEDLKRLITSSDQFVEKKGIDGGVENNYARIWMTVNPPEVMRYISPTDRRFIVTRSSSKYCGNNEYFKTIIECMAQPGAVKAFYDYLMKYDISDFTQAQRPSTALFKELEENNLPSILHWIIDMNEIETPQQKTSDWMTQYNQWAGRNNMKVYNVTTFGLAVNDLIAKKCGISKQKPLNISKLTINKFEVMGWMKNKGFWNEEE